MTERANAYRGLPLRMLFGFVGVWIVARPLLFDLGPPKEELAALPKMALMGDNRIQPELEDVIGAQAPQGSQPSASNAVKLGTSPFHPSLFVQIPMPMPTSIAPSPVEKEGRRFEVFSSNKLAKLLPSPQALTRDQFSIAPSLSKDLVPLRAERGTAKEIARAPIDRWSGSAWLLWRDGSEKPRVNGALSPRYGGSQTGLRLAYRIDNDGRAEVYGRATAALQSEGKDVATGIAVKPLPRVNIALAAEYRQALDDGARSGPALMTYGGFGPRPLGSGWTAEGYAQAGVVGVKNPLAFADGGVRIKRPIATIGPVPVSMGVGAWAGAQDDSGRADVGPMVDFDLSQVTKAPMRASIDWRQRVAGNATPDSGIAVTLATDF